MPTDTAPIRDIRYDESRAKLIVSFEDGCAHIYVGVPGEVHRSFLGAPSREDFLAEEISDQYPYNRLDAGEGQRPS
jgi:lysyl-tRNA synthetase class 2